MKGKRREESREELWCPYCDEGIMDSQLPYCQPCRVTTFYCPECQQPVPRQKEVCPNCGAEIRPPVSKET
jgi:predicted amidophosphoribosyltransferase